MTADLDLSPEAVERLAKRAEKAALVAADRNLAGVMQVLDATYPTLRAQSAENARLRAERDAAWQAGAKAMQALWNAAAGATTAICHALDDGAVSDDGHAAILDLALTELNDSLAQCRTLPVPDKEGE